MLVLALACSPALAQQNIPSNVKTAADAEPYRKQIATVIANRLIKLKSDDPADSRKWFGDQVAKSATTTASFLDVYAEEVNKAIQNALHPIPAPPTPPPFQVRLNLAIINAAIAQHDTNARLVASTADFLADPSGMVVLWGMKAAKYELAGNLKQQKAFRKADLIKAILDAVRAHPDSGPIADEAYEALTFYVADSALTATDAAAIKEVIPAIFDLMNFRLSLFAAAPPPALFGDGKAVGFLARTKVWDVETPAQQAKALDVYCKFLEADAKLVLVVEDHAELLESMHQIGRAMLVIGAVKANPALDTAATQLSGISAESTQENIDQRVKAMRDAVDQVYPAH